MTFEVKSYPPAEFYSKYRSFLAPNGLLATPKQIFNNTKLNNCNAEATIRKAFKMTLKKMARRRNKCANCYRECQGGKEVACETCRMVQYCSIYCKERRIDSHSIICLDLQGEKIDQVIECLPSPVPVGKDIMKGPGGHVNNWQDWFENHTNLSGRILPSARIVKLWWEYTGQMYPGDDAIESSLMRIVSNMFSTVLTIGYIAYWNGGSSRNLKLESSNQNAFLKETENEFNIHLIGADIPEVTAVESGLIKLSSRVCRMPLRITLVSPDLMNHPQMLDWQVLNPVQVSPNVKACAYAGLYHEFWELHVQNTKSQISRPDLCIAIHPGVHTEEMLSLWRPTLELLVEEAIPIAMTTYNEAEFDQTIQVLEELKLPISFKQSNPFASMAKKQTSYEPDHVWAVNSYLIVISK